MILMFSLFFGFVWLLLLYFLNFLVGEADHSFYCFLLISFGFEFGHFLPVGEELTTGFLEIGFVVVGAASSPSSFHE